jgi:hypothetical protein
LKNTIKIKKDKKLDGTTLIEIPRLGIKVYAENKEDIESAILEATLALCLSFETHGDGVENELRKLGLI